MKSNHPIEELPWKRSLQFRESAVGYASRLAAINGRPLSTFLREMRIAPYDLDQSVPSAVKAVAILGAVDERSLLRFSPIRSLDGIHTEVAGEKLLRLSYNRSYFKFCPQCVCEDLDRFDGPKATRPWLRPEWMINHFRSCDIHRVAFVKTTAIARPFEPLDFSTDMFAFLPDLKSLASCADPRPVSTFQAWLNGRLGSGRGDPTWLADMQLYVAVGLCEAVGISRLHHPKVKTSTLSIEQWAEAADAGYDVLSQGPDGLRSLLTDLNAAQRETRGVWGPRDTFGYAYGLLQKTLEDPAYDAVRDVVRTFALGNMPLEPGSEVLGTIVDTRTVHTIRSAAKASGVHALSMRRYFERMGFAADDETLERMDHRVTASSKDLEELVEDLRDSLTFPKIMKLTGIPRLHLRAMVDGGHLPTLANSRGKANAKHKVARRAVDDMMRRMFDGAIEVAGPSEGRVSVERARNASHATLERLMDILFGGELRWKGRIAGVDGYAALLLDAEELKGLVRSEGPRANLTKAEFAKFVPGITPQFVELLVALELLDKVMEFSPEARRMVPVISIESAEAFKRRFVSLGELVRATKLHQKHVLALLAEVGIHPAVDPKAVKVVLFDRPQVDGVVQKTDRFWTWKRRIRSSILSGDIRQARSRDLRSGEDASAPTNQQAKV